MDVECSGRSLATLLVAWVGAAMVASVLLRWKYMWIALTILTLLFLFACGYAACNARRTQARVMMTDEARIIESRRRERNIQSVSGSVDNCAEVTEPPAYQTYWIADLPPPYAAVIGAESQPPMSGSSEPEPTTPSRLPNPPPYYVAIQSETSAAQSSDQGSSRSPNPAGTSSPEFQPSMLGETTIGRRERILESPIAHWDEDKTLTTEHSATSENNTQNSSQTVLAAGTHYLSNIISCTFGRGPRRNPERNSTTTATTTRERPDISQSPTIGVSSQETAIRSIASTL